MFNGVNTDQASGGNPQLKRYLQGAEDAINNVGNSAGVQPTTTANQTIPSGGINSSGNPTIAVTGQDGHYTVAFTPPADVVPTLFYQLQSSLSLNFDAAGNVTSFGGDAGSTQLSWLINDPNQTKFFRFRYSAQGYAWSNWIYYSSAELCGPIAVWSGLELTSSTTLLTSQIYTTDGSNALSQHLTSTQIDLAAKDWNCGTQVIHYNAGSVDPGSYGMFYVYADDPKKTGGTITLFTTQNLGDLTAADGRICFGNITTAMGGGGTGGGGGSCPMTGSMATMYDNTKKTVESLRKGDVVKAVDGGPETLQSDPIPSVQPCFSLTFANGIQTIGASSTHWLRRDNGQLADLFSSIVGEQYRTDQGPSAITAKTFLGLQTVWPIELDRTRTYIVDDVESHNLKPGPP